MGYCIRCERSWTSLSEAHCSGCCNSFSSVFAFDKHRFGQGEDRRCLEIEEMLAKKMVYDTDTRKWVSEAKPIGAFPNAITPNLPKQGQKGIPSHVASKKGV